MAFVRQFLEKNCSNTGDFWVALYLLLLDYSHGVRITDANRLHGIWRRRAKKVELLLAEEMHCDRNAVKGRVDVLMRELYKKGTQKMNPLGIALASAVIYYIERFATGLFTFKVEANIGTDVFPKLKNFRRKSVDIVAFKNRSPYAVISSKWGIRHDRIRDPQEESETYKVEEPSLKFFVVTNEFDQARLEKLINYPSIDGVFHANRELVLEMYEGDSTKLQHLRDFSEILPHFSL